MLQKFSASSLFCSNQWFPSTKLFCTAVHTRCGSLEVNGFTKKKNPCQPQIRSFTSVALTLELFCFVHRNIFMWWLLLTG